MKLTLIAALAQNRAIGFQNRLLYALPNDMKRFRQLTSGHTVLMGRRTFESLPKGALPNRRNLVLSRNASFSAPNVEVFDTLTAALKACEQEEEVFVIGGSSVYEETLPLASRLCLTWVEDVPAQADAFFPCWNDGEWHMVHEESHLTDERHAQAYRFVDYERVAQD